MSSARTCRSIHRKLVAFTLPLASLLTFITHDVASAATCPAGWTAVGSTSECELVVTASGSVTIPAEFAKFDVLVVAGGGGGGGGTYSSIGYGHGGGGGAGEYKVCRSLALSGSVSVTIGDGGTGGAKGSATPAVAPTDGGDGGNSSISTCTAAGGKGGKRGADAESTATYATSGFGYGGASGNGNPGGHAQWMDTALSPKTWYVSSAGGGAGSGNSSMSVGGGWGPGGWGGTPTDGCFVANTQSYGGGGSGGSYGTQSARDGGGSGGKSYNHTLPTPGQANTGGGGGGGIGTGTPGYSEDGAAGGSGVVVLRATTAAAPTITEISPTFGSPMGGTTLTVKGTGFSCAPTIKLGTTECIDVTPVSPTEVTCTTPAGSGAVNVVSETVAGVSTNAISYNFGSEPAAASTTTTDPSPTTTADGAQLRGTPNAGELPSAGLASTLTMSGVLAIALFLGTASRFSGRRRGTRTDGWD